ncbi:MAG: hypothetical protein H0U87_07540 [Acidobacteria bacterium]|jgi:hypothetical protein|nr:hypothetical protein [Acidobacteriota bacterium]
MSQFAELFKAVKNEPKNSPGNNENVKPAAVKKLNQVKDDKGAENKSSDELNSDAQNLQKQTQVSEKAGAASKAGERLPQIQAQHQEEPNITGSPKKIGKSSNADYTQVLTYIRRDTHRQIKKVLIDDPDERNLSDLVEELLSDWLKKNV